MADINERRRKEKMCYPFHELHVKFNFIFLQIRLKLNKSNLQLLNLKMQHLRSNVYLSIADILDNKCLIRTAIIDDDHPIIFR